MPSPIPPSKVLAFKRAPGPSKKAAGADGLDGPQSVRKWDLRTALTLVVLTSILVGGVIGLARLVPAVARPAAVARPSGP